MYNKTAINNFSPNFGSQLSSDSLNEFYGKWRHSGITKSMVSFKQQAFPSYASTVTFRQIVQRV